MTPEGGLDSLSGKVAGVDKNTCSLRRARPNPPSGCKDLSPSEERPGLLQTEPPAFCSTPSTAISYFLRPYCVQAQLRYLGIKVESTCSPNMSEESPQPTIWNVYLSPGNMSALKGKKEEQVGESKSTSLDSVAEAGCAEETAFE